MEQLLLANKNVLITGGTSGIGLATVRRFVAEGARVTATGSHAAGVEEAARLLGPGVEMLVSDARDVAAIDALVRGVSERHGPIDVLFVNAGRPILASIEQTTPDMLDEQLRIHLTGPWHTLRLAMPHVRSGGAIIFNTSIANASNTVGFAPYGVAKAALRTLMRYAAAELAPRRVRVNAISPGAVDTPVVDKMGLPPEQRTEILQLLKEGTPFGRMGTPEEIAAIALFLASDAASFMTGTELTVDGGATLM